MFRKLINPDVRNTLITDMMNLPFLDGEEEGEDDSMVLWDENSAQPISRDLQHALETFIGSESPLTARFLSHLTISGLTYTISPKHAGNSNVLFKADADNHPFPTRIDNVVQILIGGKIQTLIAARRYHRSQVKDDPFRRFPMLQVEIWSTHLGPIEIFKPDDIHAHFAKAEVTWEEVNVTVVASLSRVSHSCSIFSNLCF
jgi:hypothetical protein